MQYSTFHIENRGQLHVAAYTRIDDDGPLWERAFDTVTVGGNEIVPSDEVRIERQAGKSDLDASVTTGLEGGTTLRIETDSGCDHPVIGLERL